MTIFFQPDIVGFGDRVGFGWWLLYHAEEHKQFTGIGQTGVNKFSMQDFDLTGWTWEDPQVMTDWASAHQAMHETLRQATNIAGFDLSQIDFQNKDYFTIWMDAHAQEHFAIRQAFGIVV